MQLIEHTTPVVGVLEIVGTDIDKLRDMIIQTTDPQYLEPKLQPLRLKHHLSLNLDQDGVFWVPYTDGSGTYGITLEGFKQYCVSTGYNFITMTQYDFSHNLRRTPPETAADAQEQPPDPPTPAVHEANGAQPDQGVELVESAGGEDPHRKDPEDSDVGDTGLPLNMTVGPKKRDTGAPSPYPKKEAHND